MDKNELKERTKRFSLNCIHIIESLPSNRTTEVIAKQLIRSATSVAANYRSACRAKSLADFIYKINIVEEEADESHFWIELLIDLYPNQSTLLSLKDEANQLTAIFTAIGKTSKERRSP